MSSLTKLVFVFVFVFVKGGVFVFAFIFVYATHTCYNFLTTLSSNGRTPSQVMETGVRIPLRLHCHWSDIFLGVIPQSNLLLRGIFITIKNKKCIHSD